ncbi:MAG: 3-phosphoserine/phosphohydroxythreonine transaminase [Acidimicrobiia bacterium]|nr:3-phosphoserine/phosphohydroxythreonine transaminase [Acidimicrobiia bacterium]MBT8191944.1 3-phosphoserine/phosphohydroxythreonine transaminase [Acidimicrobiia bacterium]MBT8248337.1 3-phosphoserine/phosphohydroxythreonine transaminase [Acidimicrobiia bacterium]NNF87563.1 3-phosphoserine/phosphohydroxythreonine transaminase [Acidimicrobiia bacterium]NNJ46767.1 3-phosphoserine/phosphohydroxythreonine transaminase [Acidimicrobiia bacterium]
MRAVNFCAGPCTLPQSVLEEAQAEFVDYAGTGMSLIEMSHRSPEYDAVHNETLELVRSLFAVPDEFEVLFLQGGATLQFAMVPLNLLAGGGSAGYVVSGSWGKKALEDAAYHGDVHTAWSGSDSGFTRMPAGDEVEIRPEWQYLHVTSNETIHGIRMVDWPDADIPLVGDMSSDYLSRPIPWERFDAIYGGAQKNLGPAGLAIVFVRRSVLAETNRDLAAYLRWDIHADKNSLYNTPPVFAIYMMGKTLKWIQAQGGLAAMEAAAGARADLIYGAIDDSDGYYRSPVDPAARSLMNVVFRLPDEGSEARFISEAKAHQLLSLKGHRSVGGIRASLYNAMPMSGVEALASFMDSFR